MQIRRRIGAIDAKRNTLLALATAYEELRLLSNASVF